MTNSPTGGQSSSNNEDDQCTLLGKYIVVLYDDQPFPGLVVDVDHTDVEVKCLNKVVNNRFYWPQIDDVCWYSKDKVVSVIPEPQCVTRRYLKVHSPTWEQIVNGLDI